jgi:hypothetical protein
MSKDLLCFFSSSALISIARTGGGSTGLQQFTNLPLKRERQNDAERVE